MAKTTGKDALIDLLSKESVEYVFGIPGATEIVFMDALERANDIEYILGLNEIVCAGMAEGYARASGKPGFLNLHTGPGMAAALPMLYNACSGNVPIVITVGQQHSRLLQRDPHLTGDIVGMGKLFSKWATEIIHAQDIPVTVQRAFKMSIQHPAGPVLVSIPYDVLDGELDYTYKDNTRVYPGVRPDAESLVLAIELLKKAKNPVIFVESGVSRCNAIEETVRFAEMIGAKVFQSWMSDVNFPVTHGQYLGDLDPTSPPARKILEGVDLLIGIGCPMFAQAFVNPEPTLPNDIKIMQFDENPWEIGKNFPVDCGIQCDIKAGLTDILAKMEGQLDDGYQKMAASRRLSILAEKKMKLAMLEEQVQAEKDQCPIAISRLMSDLKKALPADTIIVDDCWSSSAMLRQVLDLDTPDSFIRARNGGSIGSGLPMALGAKLGAPDKNVVVVSGDGSAAWSMQSFWTAAKYNIPVTFIITNNATYRQVKLVRKAVLGDYPLNEKHPGMELDSPVMNFQKMAESMGVAATQVEDPNELLATLEDNIGSNHPNLIEVFVENASK